MRRRTSCGVLMVAPILGGLLMAGPTASAQRESGLGYNDTPLLPTGTWRTHDARHPQPVKVRAGTCGTQERPGLSPSDAEVLFDGKDLSRWRTEKGGPASWKVQDGYMEVVPKSGDIYTREEFGDIQLHVEWRTPAPLEKQLLKSLDKRALRKARAAPCISVGKSLGLYRQCSGGRV